MTEQEVIKELLNKLHEMTVGWAQDEWDVQTNVSISKLQKYLSDYKE